MGRSTRGGGGCLILWPVEVLERVLALLDLPSLLAAAQVCRAWRAVVDGGMLREQHLQWLKDTHVAALPEYERSAAASASDARTCLREINDAQRRIRERHTVIVSDTFSAHLDRGRTAFRMMNELVVFFGGPSGVGCTSLLHRVITGMEFGEYIPAVLLEDPQIAFHLTTPSRCTGSVPLKVKLIDYDPYLLDLSDHLLPHAHASADVLAVVVSADHPAIKTIATEWALRYVRSRSSTTPALLVVTMYERVAALPKADQERVEANIQSALASARESLPTMKLARASRDSSEEFLRILVEILLDRCTRAPSKKKCALQ